MKRALWCEPFIQACHDERRDARLRPDEVPQALAYFKEKLGQDNFTVMLNRKMIDRLNGVFPEGIEVVEHNGVASWEIWAVGVGDSPPIAPESPQNKQGVGAIPQQYANQPNGSDKTATPILKSRKKTSKAKKPKKRPVTKLSELKMSFVTAIERGKKKSGSFVTNKNGINKHGGGRPRKTSGFSKRTFFRRKKELAEQGVLL